MKTNKIRTIIASVLSVMLLTGVFAGCSKTTNSTTKSTYTDYTVTSGELKNTLSLDGYLTPSKTVTVTAEETGSKVAKILKKKGNVVSKGAAIVQLENGNYIYSPAKGKITRMAVAVGDWVYNSTTVGTMNDYSTKTSTTTGSGMQKTTTTSYTSVNIGESSSTHVTAVDVKTGDTVTAGQKLAELEDGNCIYASIAGLVSEVDIAAGDLVAPNSTIGAIVDSNFHISVSVGEDDAQSLKEGQSVDITVNALDKQITGTVSGISVEGTVSNSTTKFTVEIALGEQNGAFRTNMSAEVDILVDDVTDAVMVPIDAVTTTNGKSYVMLKDTSTNAYTLTGVETGISNDSYVQIKSGISAGDIVGVANSTTSTMNNFGGGIMGGGDMGGSQGGPQGGGQGGQMPQGAPQGQ